MPVSVNLPDRLPAVPTVGEVTGLRRTRDARIHTGDDGKAMYTIEPEVLADNAIWPRHPPPPLHAAEHAAIGLLWSRAATVATSAGCPPPTASVDCPRCSSTTGTGGPMSPERGYQQLAHGCPRRLRPFARKRMRSGLSLVRNPRSVGAKRSSTRRAPECARLRSGEARVTCGIDRPLERSTAASGPSDLQVGAPKLPAEVSATQTEIPSSGRRKVLLGFDSHDFLVLRRFFVRHDESTGTP